MVRGLCSAATPRSAASRSARDWPNRRREEFDVLAHRQVGIEILAETLRHVGDTRADRSAVTRIGHVAVQHLDPAGLDLAGAGDDGEQRRLADTIGTDQSDDAAAGNVERHRIERANSRRSEASDR